MKKIIALMLAVALSGCAAPKEEKKAKVYLPDVIVKYKDKESPRIKKADLKALSDGYRAYIKEKLTKEKKQPPVVFVEEKGQAEAEAYVFPFIIVKASKYYVFARVTSTKGSYSRELEPVLLADVSEAGAKVNASVFGAFSAFTAGLGEEQKALVFEDGPVKTEELKIEEVVVNVIRELGL